jgi:hypothetical protein
VIVIVIAVVVVIFIVSIGVAFAAAVVTAVVFAVPVALVKLPALGMPFVLRVNPVGARIGRMIIVPSDPAVMVSLGSPKAANPNDVGCGRRWGRGFEADRRRGCSDVDRDL